MIGTIEIDAIETHGTKTVPWLPSRSARWLTPDPLGGDIANPQSPNRYAYALNNPTTLTDPSGLHPPGCQSEGNNLTICLPPGGAVWYYTAYGGNAEGSILETDNWETVAGYENGDPYSYEELVPSFTFIEPGGSGFSNGAVFDGPANLPGASVRSQPAAMKACVGTGFFTGVGPGQATGNGALGIVPPIGTVAIDPRVLGLPVGTSGTNATLTTYMDEITVTPSGMALPPGFPGSFTVSDIYGPASARNHVPVPFDVYRFPTNAAADRITGNYSATIAFPASAPFACGRGFAPQH